MRKKGIGNIDLYMGLGLDAKFVVISLWGSFNKDRALDPVRFERIGWDQRPRKKNRIIINKQINKGQK